MKYQDTEDKQQLVEQLKAKTLTIKFNKINGEFREMTCTLMENIIPKIDVTRKSSLNVLSVWDTNKQDWRSIRWENIIEVVGQ